MAGIAATAVPAPESPVAPGDLSTQRAKRRRLNFACNACRKKKVRCDEQQPCCRNCRAAGIPCVTTDKRRPGVPIRRHEAGNQRSLSPLAVTSLSVVSRRASDGQIYAHRNSISDSPSGLSAPTTTRSRRMSNIGGESGREKRSEIVVGRRDGDEGSGRGQEEVHLNPDSHAEIRPDGTRRFAGRLPILTQNSGRTSLELLTDWLDLAFYRLGLHSQFAPGMLLSSIPPSLSSVTANGPFETAAISTDVPGLPSLQECRKLVDVYFRDINSIFPLLDRRQITQDLKVACLFGGPHRLLRERGLPPLLLLYLVFGLGAIGAPELDFSTDLSHRIISFCQTLLGHVMGWNTIEAVQICFLLSVSLRCLDRVSSSWSSIGVCVSMAVSLGMNRRSVSLPNQANGSARGGSRGAEVERQLTWWSIFAWEKLHAFELGRASCIIDSDCNRQELDEHQSDAPSPVRVSTPSSIEALESECWAQSDLLVLVSLAKTLSSISRKCIQMRNKEDRAITESAMTEKTKTTVSSCLEVMEWAEGLDAKYRLQTDLLTGSRASPLALFLGLSFNNALIMLMRNTILVNPVILQRFIDRVSGSKSWAPLLKRSNGVAVNAARRIVRLLVEVTEMDLSPVLPSLITPLHAAYILMVQVINDPKSRTISSDLSLIQQAYGFALQHYARFASDGRLKVLLDGLGDFMMRQITAAHGGTMMSNVIWPGASFAFGTPMHNMNSLPPSSLFSTAPDCTSTNGNFPSVAESNVSLAPGSKESATPIASPGPARPESTADVHMDSHLSTVHTITSEQPLVASFRGLDENGQDFAGLDAPWWPVPIDDIGWDWADLAQVI